MKVPAPSFEVQTSIEIEASADEVWQVLTELEYYPAWNPMITRASGDLAPGARLHLRFETAGGRARDFRPRLLVVDPGRELRWLGNPSFPGLLVSEHYFRLGPTARGSCQVEHDMVFRGLLVPLLRSRADAATRGRFEDMNAALKRRVETREQD